MEDLLRLAAELQAMAIVPLLLKVTLIALIGRLVIAALPRAAAAVRFAIAMTTLAGSLVMPLIAFSPLRIAIPVLHRQAVYQPADENSHAVINAAARALPGLAQPIAISQQVFATWRGWVLMIYIGIGVLALGRLLLGIATLRSLIRNAVEVVDGTLLDQLRAVTATTPRLLVSDRTTVPVMWGIANPVLILPRDAATWSAERLHVVYLHELAHWRRRDVLALLLMRVATAVYWFHPIVWSLDKAGRRDCERACDDVVLSNGTRASEYADHLLAIARNMPRTDPFGAVTVAMSRPAELEGRLLAILHDRIRRGAASLPLYGTLAVATLMIAVPLAAAHFTFAKSDVELGVERGIAGGVAGGVPGGIEGGVPGGVKGGVKGGVEGGVKDAIEDWNQRGKNDLRQQRYDDAIADFSNVVRADPYYSSARYNLACAYALSGDKKRALHELRDSVVAGYSDGDHMRKDEDLASIRGPELDAIAELADNLVISQWGSDWRAAVPRYEAFAKAHPDLMRAWYNLGFVLIEAHEDRRGIEVYQRVLQSGYRPGATMYNLACAYAHLGERQTALRWLHEAKSAGFEVGGYAASDLDLASLRDDPWLANLIATKKAKKDR